MDFVDLVILVQIAIGACLLCSAIWAGRKAYSEYVDCIDGDALFAGLILYSLIGSAVGALLIAGHPFTVIWLS